MNLMKQGSSNLSVCRRSWPGVTLVLAALIATGLAALSGPSFAQAPQKPVDDGSVMRISAQSFDDTMSSLTQAIEAENLMVIHIIDGQKMMRMAGKQIGPMNQVFFFHPRYMRRVWETNPMAGIQIPLKFIVMEKPDKKVVIRYLKPSTLLGKYPGMAQLAEELDGIVARIADAAAKSGK